MQQIKVCPICGLPQQWEMWRRCACGYDFGPPEHKQRSIDTNSEAAKIPIEKLSQEYLRRMLLVQRAWLPLIVIVFACILLFGVVLFPHSKWMLPVMGVGFAILFGFLTKVNRCPSCNRPFSRNHILGQCEWCGIKFILVRRD